MIVGEREALPAQRHSTTHEVTLYDSLGSRVRVYMTIGFYPDGRPGEVFLTASKPGTILRGLLDSLAVMVSHALQWGVPVAEVADALGRFVYEPNGPTDDADVPVVSSLSAWIAQRLVIAAAPDALPIP